MTELKRYESPASEFLGRNNHIRTCDLIIVVNADEEPITLYGRCEDGQQENIVCHELSKRSSSILEFIVPAYQAYRTYYLVSPAI